MITLAIIVVLALGGGVSFAAENAVPGDVLYGVKTHVNENVRAAVATSAEADARWEATLAMRRLAEAKELSARGELSAEVAADLSAEFAAHAEAALDAAAKLSAEGNAAVASEITTDIEASVKTYSSVFAQVLGSANASAEANLTNVLNSTKVRVQAGDVNADGRVITGDVDGDGRADVNATVNNNASIKSETNAEAHSGDGTTSTKGSVDVNVGL